MPRMLVDGDDKLLWVPDGGITTVSSTTVAQLTAVGVLDISCLVTKTNFALGATGDAVLSDPALCAAGDSGVPGLTSYEAGMDFYRWTTVGEDDAWTTFTGKGIGGFLAHRIGLPSATAPLAGQEWAIYGVLTGSPRKIVPDAQGGYRKFRQEFLVQGDLVDERVTIA